MQALERMTLSQYCARVLPLVSPEGRADPDAIDRIGAMVTFLARFGVKTERDVKDVLVASWPRGVAALQTSGAREILEDDEREDWLKAMQLVHLLESDRG